jgi:hypothetical protein
MPNPDGTLTDAERRALLTQAGPTGGFVPATDVPYDRSLTAAQNQLNQQNANIASGNLLGGDAAHNVGGQSNIDPNLSQGEYLAKHERDYALGVNNSAPAAAMIGSALATGDQYAAQFGGDAAHAGLQSSAAGRRGLSMYGGDTSQYGASLANAQHDRAMQTGAYGQLMAFANQGPGASAAQAQLQGATDANTQNALALARSGRGMGSSAAALRAAVNQNALTQQTSNNQMAALRAQENTAYQAQRLQALGGAGTLAGQTVQTDQGTAASGLAGAQYATDTALKGTSLNDTTSLAWAQQKQAAEQAGLVAQMGGQNQALNVNTAALGGREAADSSLTQQYGVSKGLALEAKKESDDNRRGWVGAGLAAGGSILSVLSDVRSKTNIRSLSGEDDGSGREYAVRDPNNPSQFISSYQSISDASHQAHGAPLRASSYDGPRRVLDGSNPYQPARQLDQSNPYTQLQSLAQKYGAAGVAEQPKAVSEYMSTKPTEKTLQRFAHDASHPILSAGDSLLADSARNAPPSMYEYKDKRDGAGVYTGPMAQDLARHPVTQGAVGQDPSTGKLYVDGARAGMVGLAQNHSQQKQLDTLDAKLAELQGLLKRKPGDDKATSFRTSTGGL